jgi:RNA polymerase sigma-70 factor (ECF subfamily)
MEESVAIARLKEGDITGLKVLVELYQIEAVQAAVLITQNRPRAEDIVQAAFLRSFEKIAGFDDSRPFRPWFLQSVVNDSIKAVLKQKRQLSLPDDDEDAELKALCRRLDETVREPEEVLQRRQLMDEIQSAISRLSPAQRAVIVMHYFLGISTKEMAVKMDVEAGTIRWHLSQARKRLREFLLASK